MIFNAPTSDLKGAITPLTNGVLCTTATDKNLNNYKTAGVYFFGTDTINGPGFNWFTLNVEVVDGAPIVVQTATKADGSAIKTRTSYNNWASGWQTIYDKDADAYSNAYTPTFTWGGSEPAPTVANVDFTYHLISGKYMYITGRFQMVNKNSTNTSTSLGFSLPPGYICATDNVGHFGTVYSDSGSTNVVVRARINSNGVLTAKGSAGDYSWSSYSDGTYYSINCLFPVKKA